MTLNAGAKLGPYEIRSALGAGGMGEVYKARDTRLDRTVAIKVLPAHVAADPDLRARFERGALPLGQALAIAIQIASALDKAHRQGITHRDLKPGNVMLTKSGAGRLGSPQVKLLDFGLAKLRPAASGAVAGMSAGPTMSAPLTGQGTILGTLQYMAPEQLEGHDADARTDIFAFGAVVYEMMTGKKAFEGKSQASLIAAILERDPPPISTLQPLTPPALDHIVKRCLAKDPEDRWQTARDLEEQLKWIAEAGSQAGGADTRSVRFQIALPDTWLLKQGIGSGAAAPLAVSPDGQRIAFVASTAAGAASPGFSSAREAVHHVHQREGDGRAAVGRHD